MRFDELARDGKTKPGSALAARLVTVLSALSLLKRLRDVHSTLCRSTMALIDHTEPQHAVSVAIHGINGKVDRHSVATKLDGVVDEIVQDLLQALRL